jgi:hypothetical protein
MSICTMSLTFVTTLAFAGSALAQPAPRTTVSFTAGVVSGASDTGVTLGGSVLFDITERLSIEGQGTYIDRGAGADGFGVFASLLVNLRESSQPVVPYVAVGGGILHVSYDLSNPRFLGPVGMQFAPGSTVCPVPGTGMGLGHHPGWPSGAASCPVTVAGYWGVGHLPDFYARRLGPLAFPHRGHWGMRPFTDPALSVGGGVRIPVTERLMLRPDVRALAVWGDGDTHALGVFVMHVGYRF